MEHLDHHLPRAPGSYGIDKRIDIGLLVVLVSGGRVDWDDALYSGEASTFIDWSSDEVEPMLIAILPGVELCIPTSALIDTRAISETSLVS